MKSLKQDFIISELDKEFVKEYKGESNYLDIIDPEDTSLGLCWKFQYLHVCIEKVTPTKVMLVIKLLGVNIGRFVLTKKNTTIKIKENIGGDFARVEVEISANFQKREIRAKGRMCKLFVCHNFEQRILKW
ncbi:hypothetical protein GWK08_08960 [Leptobacterium flavescens]|uniref:Uncharacterized protein n=1 Tax=Leptobacterium flavescens TaxID=472055 RepID=A0A6P0UK15_9FLAO|nr:hypothetical protein [Leptobacterium flavescens]NER13564.1 hypothetical protein [Leptobacterium flavescens]